MQKVPTDHFNVISGAWKYKRTNQLQHCDNVHMYLPIHLSKKIP